MEDTTIRKFIADQLSVWPMAAANFRALKSVEFRHFNIGGLDVMAQFNPGRMASSTANTDPAALAARPCFLCPATRPPEQFALRFDGRKGRRYNMQVNPYPIFPGHLVMARNRHVPQSIWHCFVDMLDMARKCQGYTFFYNGPHSGASAPDHMHFQAVPRGMMPLERAVDDALDVVADGRGAEAMGCGRTSGPGDGMGWDGVTDGGLRYLANVQDAELYHFRDYARGIFALRARTVKSAAKLFYRLVDCVAMRPGEDEPRFNLYAWLSGGELRVMVILRGELRSRHYTALGLNHLTVSPGCVDMAGVFICPVREDFDKMDEGLIREMLDDVCVGREAEEDVLWRLTRSQRSVEVGILAANEIVFEIISDGAGPQKVSWRDGKIDYNGVLYDELYFDAVTPSSLFAEPTFILHDVRIGIGFHWERRQEQRFAGALKFVVEGRQVRAINRVGMEDYLLSVISSEMRAGASMEFLKAHAVISRSWLLSRILERRGFAHAAKCGSKEPQGVSGGGVAPLIKSFDIPHEAFDVCADDHCQRYQGLTDEIGKTAREAVDSTWGEVLTYGGGICDTRFSKCCGGMTERFSTCWDDVDYPYLTVHPDNDGGEDFCKCEDRGILSQVLNDYDLETEDFYRWEVRYGRAELSELISRRSGVDVGEVRELIPLERGGSGRIKLLRIVGSARTIDIGKELLIRQYLSETHLKSSAFEVIADGDGFVLRGRGWGHGVGLCQIGAAVMATKGYGYRQILGHYYPGAEMGRI